MKRNRNVACAELELICIGKYFPKYTNSLVMDFYLVARRITRFQYIWHQNGRKSWLHTMVQSNWLNAFVAFLTFLPYIDYIAMFCMYYRVLQCIALCSMYQCSYNLLAKLIK